MIYLDSFKSETDINYDNAVIKALEQAKQNASHTNIIFPEGEIMLSETIKVYGAENVSFVGKNTFIKKKKCCSLFDIRNSKNISVSGFSVDYEELNFVTGVILRNDGREYTVKINEGYSLENAINVGSFIEFEAETMANRRGGNALFPFGNTEKSEIISEEERTVFIRFKEQYTPTPEGTLVFISQIPFDVPGINLDFCDDFVLRDCCFYMTPGMGIFATNGRNVTIERVDYRLLPQSDRLFSACRDGIHLMSCDGVLTIRDCYLENLGDDGLNVHSNWMFPINQIDDRTIVLDIWDTNTNLPMNKRHYAGDIFQIRDTDLQVMATRKAIRTEYTDTALTVEFDRPLTKQMAEGVYYNLSHSPKLIFEGNTVKNSRGHGVLVQTDNFAEIRNNRFINNFYAGVKITTGFAESVPSDNIVVENNTVEGNQYFPELGDIFVASWHGAAKAGVFKDIIIRNNIIRKTADVGASIHVEATDTAIVEGNALSNTLPASDPTRMMNETCNIKIKRSRNITLKNNKFEGNIEENGSYIIDEESEIGGTVFE